MTLIRKLDLACATISGDALQALAPLQSLRDLDLTGTTVTAQAIQALRAAIPGLTSVRWTPPGRRTDASPQFDFHAEPAEE